MDSYAVIDFETTGLSAGPDRIIEVAAAIVRDGEIVGTFTELMDPGCSIPPFITSLTGISNAMVRGRPRPELVMPSLRAFLGDHACVAHNASFDQRFFRSEMERAGATHERTFLCSMMIARRLLQDAPNHKLGTLVEHLGLEPPAGMRAHRALADVLMTCSLWRHLISLVRHRLGGRQPDIEILRALMTRPKHSVDLYLHGLATQAACVRPS